LFNPPEHDRQKFNAFLQQIGATLGATWRPGERLLTSLLLVMALVFWIFGRRVGERGLPGL